MVLRGVARRRKVSPLVELTFTTGLEVVATKLANSNAEAW